MKYEEFKSTPVLYEAYKKTRRGKRSKKAEAIFESSETENLKRIARQIDKGYLPAGLDSFMIYEPKARTINAPAFRDKIVQRDLTDNVIYPALVAGQVHSVQRLCRTDRKGAALRRGHDGKADAALFSQTKGR